jgi:ribonuclease HI
MMLRERGDLRQVYVDAAIRAERGQCGLAAIVRDTRGAVTQWLGTTTSRLTNNEAEYAAAIFALGQLKNDPARPVVVFSDSLILVHQMQGRAATRAPELRQKQAELRQLVAGFASVRFQHIQREHNRLADALANEVADGQSPVGVYGYGR